jgi:hypothetical protein
MMEQMLAAAARLPGACQGRSPQDRPMDSSRRTPRTTALHLHRRATQLAVPTCRTTLCSWCGRRRLPDGRWVTPPAGVKPSWAGEPVSHGICVDCLRAQQQAPGRQ